MTKKYTFLHHFNSFNSLLSECSMHEEALAQLPFL